MLIIPCHVVKKGRFKVLSQIISPILTLVLGLIALLHFAWAFGSTLPCANEQELARTVVGRRGITRMPSAKATLFVAVCVLSAAIVAYLLGQQPRGDGLKWVLGPIGLFLGILFIGRGVIGVMPAFERASPEKPFLQLNRTLYSPLSFLIGLGFLILSLSLPNWTWRLSGIFG